MKQTFPRCKGGSGSLSFHFLNKDFLPYRGRLNDDSDYDGDGDQDGDDDGDAADDDADDDHDVDYDDDDDD